MQRLQKQLGIHSIIDAPAINDSNVDARLCQAVVAIMDAKHQLPQSLDIVDQEGVVRQLMAVDDNLPMPELIAAYSLINGKLAR